MAALIVPVALFWSSAGFADELHSMPRAIQRVKSSGVRVDLVELGIKKPGTESSPVSNLFASPMPILMPTPSQVPTISLAQVQPGSLTQLQVDLADEEARISRIFQAQKQSIDSYVMDPSEKVKQNYPAVIAALTTVCCGKNPKGVAPEEIQRLLQQTGLSAGH